MAPVTRFRPFWSLFVSRTENWLQRMSQTGLHISRIDFDRRLFVFDRGDPVNYRYRFTYNKLGLACDAHIEKTLQKDGWERRIDLEKWSLYRCPGTREFSSVPNRRGLYLRNNSLLGLYNTISFLVLVAALAVSAACLTAAGDLTFGTVLVLAGVFAGLIVMNFLIFIAFTRSNEMLLEELGSTLNPDYALYRHYVKNRTFEKWLEKLFIKDGDIIRKFWPLWYFSPDRLEERLGRMEREGLNFYKISKSGALFYFIKGKPKNVSYCVVVWETNSLDDTIDYLKRGWLTVFSTTGQLGKTIVLAKQYDGAEPGFFSSGGELMRNAKRVALKYALTAVAVMIFMTLLLTIALILGSPAGYLPAAAAASCLLLLIRLALYLRRSRKTAARLQQSDCGA